MLYASVNATNPTKEETIIKTNYLEDHNITEFYQWRIKTESGIFSGASQTINEVNKDISALTQNTKVITKSITPIVINKNKLGEKIYTWSIITKKGHASGQSLSLEEAKNMLKSLHTEKVMKSNIIETKNILK
ncbi:hypothetical protein APS56_08325 [Pseudalgibacter alginicilyticus]|uniref:Uncharacterized protein n=2 Tax=Pseudalgibacter alginicilyticus TaxID=1736674 RepID=A0A0P0D2G3_9FLAO|nr:hypothetical protein APS56_08325 [Pseudalgibacter alginicilyticus]